MITEQIKYKDILIQVNKLQNIIIKNKGDIGFDFDKIADFDKELNKLNDIWDSYGREIIKQ